MTRRPAGLKSSAVPLLVRPISSAIANRMIGMLVFPNMQKHLGFLEQQLATSGGDFLCGELSAVDILLSYPLLAGRGSLDGMGNWGKGSAKDAFPKVFAYMDRLEAQPGWTRAVEKAKALDHGKFSLMP